MRPWVLLGLSVVVATGVVWAVVDDGDERDALPKVDAVRDCRTHVEGSSRRPTRGGT